MNTAGEAAASPVTHVGKALTRREDAALLAGRGLFCDDVLFENLAYGLVVRSPYAHAKILTIETAAAARHPGVLAVLTASDLHAAGVGVIQPNWLVGDIEVPVRTVLAVDRVRFVGDPVAFVVATSREAAADAAELVSVNYEELSAVVDEEAAAAPDAPQLHTNVPGNKVGVYEVGGGNVEAAFASADLVVRLRLINNRVIPSPLEPRAIVAKFEAFTQKFTMYVPSQMPHMCRRWVAEVMGIPEHLLRVISPDVGGGFGAKMHFYPEEILVPFAARLLQRPVKWTETRSESHVSTTHGRAHTEYIEAAAKRDGRILGMRLKTYANMGAYLSNMATGIPTINCANFATGCYKIPNYHAHVDLMLTNTVPVDAYRGAGRPEAAYIIERTVDAVANELGLDPAAVRELNLVQPEDFPYAPFGHPALSFDSGNYQRTFEHAKRLIGYDGIREMQAVERSMGKYRGVAVTNYNEICGVGPSHYLSMVGFSRGGWESATLRVHSDGKLTLLTGSMPTGHGHGTTFAQIVASELQVPVKDVEVVYGDTDKVQMGNGTYNSRSMPVGGSAAAVCARKVLAKARRYAAAWLEVDDVERVTYAAGEFSHADRSDSVSFAEVARLAHLGHLRPPGDAPGLDETVFYDPSGLSAPHGSHAALVEVDVKTGRVQLLDYVAVDDIGVVLNPLLATGQIHGGVAQGVGQALFEAAAYDAGGQLLAGSLLDYALPKSDQLCAIRSVFFETPTQTNPLGAKGVGEAGACAAPPVIVAAVCDALAPFGITHIDMPITPPRIWAAMERAKLERHDGIDNRESKGAPNGKLG